MHCHCLSCGTRDYRSQFHQEQDTEPEFGLYVWYDACPNCGSLDVDVLSDDGMRLEQAGVL